MLKKDPYYVRLSGRGGQGILLASVILSEAAMKDGLNVVQTQSYGPQARLGASKGELVLSKKDISFPEVEVPDLVVCLSRDAYVKYGRELPSESLQIVDETVLLEKTVEHALLLPIIRTARELGDEIIANIVALGALVKLTEIVSPKSLKLAVQSRVKPAYLELNLKALEAGFKLGTQQASTLTQVFFDIPPPSLK